MTRRGALRSLGGASAGLAALGFIGCGDDDDSSSPTSAAGQPTGAATSADAPRVGGKLNAGTLYNTFSLDPATGTGGGDHNFFWTMHDNLVAYDQKGLLDASQSLASSWEQKDDVTVVFNLRDGVKFHDGTAFDAEAVAYNIDRIRAPETKSVVAGVYAIIDKVDVVDTLTLRLTMKAPNAAFLTNLGDRGGAYASPKAVDELGDRIKSNPVGTGPFKFKEWTPDDHITVVKNPDYWGKDAAGSPLPYLDEVNWQLIPEPAVQVANLEQGLMQTAPATVQDWDRLEANNDLEVSYFVGFEWKGLWFNPQLAPINNPMIRQALAYAPNRQDFTDALTLGKGPVALGVVTPAQWAWDDSLKAPTYDPKKAKDLVTAAGAEGTAIPFFSPTTAEQEQLFALWKENLADVGLEATTVQGVFADYLAGKHSMLMAQFSIRVDPDGMIGELYHSAGSYNPGHAPNDAMDRLVEAARETYDVEERKAKYKEVQELAFADGFGSYVYYSVVSQASSKDLGGVGTLFGAEGKPRYKHLWLKA